MQIPEQIEDLFVTTGGVAFETQSLQDIYTTVETVHKDDVENVIRLIYKSLLKIENNHDFRYLK